MTSISCGRCRSSCEIQYIAGNNGSPLKPEQTISWVLWRKARPSNQEALVVYSVFVLKEMMAWLRCRATLPFCNLQRICWRPLWLQMVHRGTYKEESIRINTFPTAVRTLFLFYNNCQCFEAARSSVGRTSFQDRTCCATRQTRKIAATGHVYTQMVFRHF